jgi:NADPH:quinone reductase-like Zn-dependent oxidoreductase
VQARAIGTVRDGGHLATITQDPPDEQRGIVIMSVIVQPDGHALGELAELLAAGELDVSIAATFPLEDAAVAFAGATRGGARRSGRDSSLTRRGSSSQGLSGDPTSSSTAIAAGQR